MNTSTSEKTETEKKFSNLLEQKLEATKLRMQAEALVIRNTALMREQEKLIAELNQRLDVLVKKLNEERNVK